MNAGMTIRYNFGNLELAQESIGEFVDAMYAVLEDVDAKAQPVLTDESCDGNFVEAYNGAKVNWDLAASEISRLMGQLSTAVGQAAEDMDFQDKKWAATF